MSSTTSSTRKTSKKFTNALDAKAQMNQITGGITGSFESFHIAGKETKQDIQIDNEGLAEIDNELYKLNKRKAVLEARMQSGKAWIEHYETNIAPFEGQYDKMVSGIGEIYDKACEGHANGLKLLQKEFDYHPAYKRYKDKFTASPFRPK